MKIYNGNFSANALRVRAVALELGLDFEIVEINVMGGENKTEDYLAINPNGKIPALEDDGFIIWESRAITSYLAGKRPEAGLYPDDIKQRAIVDQWSYWQTVHLGPAMSKVIFERFFKPKFRMGETDPVAIDSGVKEIAQFLPVLEAGLNGKDWVAGNLSVADFALASAFVFRKEGDISLADYPNVTGWIDRMESRPSWQEAVKPLVAMMS
ncbi:glutathione S-transferase family protein [Nioella aestuarii]|uniref:glutathione S-transferase family protein n=1 Tax=Nioella aestuarii TaxID=1662864 RepID=UPI003D7F6AED